MIEKIKNKFIQQFKTKGFTHVPRVSMLSKAFPTNFTPSGGEERLAEILAKENPKESFCVIQPCFRYQDVDNISTDFHAPLFEMGVAISVNELTLKDMIAQFFVLFDAFGLDREKLKISVLDNSRVLNRHIERDEEAIKTWKKFGIKDSQFKYLGLDENFFMLPDQGYAGIKTEAFYNHKGVEMEIAVFIYLSDSVVTKDHEQYLSEFDHDVICFGIGIERWAMILQNKKTLFHLEENQPLIDLFHQLKQDLDISMDEFKKISFISKGLLFLYGDGAVDDNENRGRTSLLRKILRKLRGCYPSEIKDIESKVILPVVKRNAKVIGDDYPKISEEKNVDYTIDLIQNS